MKVFDDVAMQVIGGASVALGLLVMVIGTWRYRVLCRRLGHAAGNGPDAQS